MTEKKPQKALNYRLPIKICFYLLKQNKLNRYKMKKLLLFLLLIGILTSFNNFTIAQDDDKEKTEEVVDSAALAAQAAAKQKAAATEAKRKAEADAKIAEEEKEANQGFGILKKYFIDGGWVFMSLVLTCLIIGLAFCIERILTLNLLSSNPQKLLKKVETHLKNGDLEAAKKAAKSTRGPAASIIYQGLSRSAGGNIDEVEKAVVNYGSVQMGKLERNLVWISLFIALAPMLGFMGTVIGMVGAFDAIEKAGDISPSLVAGGIKVALLTTLFGLIVAVILQIFYNYIVSKIDSIVLGMEDSSISFVDLLVNSKK